MNVKHLNTLEGHLAPLYTLVETPLGILSGGGDGIVVEWALDAIEEGKISAKTETAIFSMLYDASSDSLWVGTQGGKLHGIHYSSKQEFKCLELGMSVFEIIILNNVLYASGAASQIQCYDLKQEHFLAPIQLPLELTKIRSMLVLDETTLLLNTSEGTVITLDLKQRVYKRYTTPHTMAINSSIALKDVIVTVGKDAYISILEKESYMPILAIPAHNYPIYKVVQHPSWNYFITASRDRTLKVWDKNTFELLKRIDGHEYCHQKSINSLLALSDGRFASASDDKTIKVWNIEL